MSEEATDSAFRSEELKRQIEAITGDIVDAIDLLTRELQRSLLMLADRVEQRMETIGFGRLSGPVVNDIQEGVKAEAKRFSQQARSKIQEITQARARLYGLGDELSALASMTAAEREALRKQLQDEITASEKTRQELEEELAEAKVKLADLEKQMRSRSTRDARRIDKLEATNKELQESLKQTQAELMQLKEQSKGAFSERDEALKQAKTLKDQLEATQASLAAATAASAGTAEEVDKLKEELVDARSKITAVEEAKGAVQSELETLKKQLEEALADKQLTSEELTKIQETSKTLDEKALKLGKSLSTAEKQIKASNARVSDLEAQVTELLDTKETQLQQIAQLEEDQKTLKDVAKLRDELSKDKEGLEKQLADALAQIEKMKEDYARFEEIKDRLELLEARVQIQDILLQKDQHYIVLTALATKIVEGKYQVSAKDLGFSPTMGVSLAAWLDKFFLDLQEEELVAIHRTAGKGLPSADIEVTKKGRELFEEAKQRAAL